MNHRTTTILPIKTADSAASLTQQSKRQRQRHLDTPRGGLARTPIWQRRRTETEASTCDAPSELAPMWRIRVLRKLHVRLTGPRFQATRRKMPTEARTASMIWCSSSMACCQASQVECISWASDVTAHIGRRAQAQRGCEHGRPTRSQRAQQLPASGARKKSRESREAQGKPCTMTMTRVQVVPRGLPVPLRARECETMAPDTVQTPVRTVNYTNLACVSEWRV